MRSPARTARSTTPAPEKARRSRPPASTFPSSQPGTMGVPAGDDFETNFTTGERNIFRQSWQRRADASLVKELPIHDQYTLRYTFDVYNITNTDQLRHSAEQREPEPRVQQRSRWPSVRRPRRCPPVAAQTTLCPADSTTAPRVLESPSTPSAARARFRCLCTWTSDPRMFLDGGRSRAGRPLPFGTQSASLAPAIRRRDGF